MIRNVHIFCRQRWEEWRKHPHLSSSSIQRAILRTHRSPDRPRPPAGGRRGGTKKIGRDRAASFYSTVSYLSFVRRSFFRVPRSGSGDLICCEQIVRTTHLSIVLPAATSTVTRGKGRGAGGRAGIRHEDTRLLCTAAPWAKNEALSNFNIDRSRAGRWPDASSASHLVLLREPSILPAWRPGLAPP